MRERGQISWIRILFRLTIVILKFKTIGGVTRQRDSAFKTMQEALYASNFPSPVCVCVCVCNAVRLAEYKVLQPVI